MKLPPTPFSSTTYSSTFSLTYGAVVVERSSYDILHIDYLFTHKMYTFGPDQTVLVHPDLSDSIVVI